MISLDELKDAAGENVGVWLEAAASTIDQRFGEGYAAANPGLVGAFVGACAVDFGATLQADFLRMIAVGLQEIAASMPSVGDGAGVAAALEGIGGTLAAIPGWPPQMEASNG